jgi:hypothetical protein
MPDKFEDRMKDYVPVNERIDTFKTAFPDGSLQSEIVELTDSRVTVKAYAYRAADDERPGIGHSSVVIPGSTPYTRGSEIENAETSAWGRAIAALGFEVKRGISSSEEIRNKAPGQGAKAKPAATTADSVAAAPVPAPAITDATIRTRYAWANAHGWDDEALDEAAIAATGKTVMDLDSLDWQLFAATIKDGPIEQAADSPPVAEPEADAAVPSAPAVPPKRDSDEYKALDVRGKAQARSYWASKELEERQPEPLNPEPETLGLSA